MFRIEVFYNFLYSIFAFAVLITIVVFIHEYGHYFFARLFKTKVITFSIGFGKKIFAKKDKQNTEWCLSAIPAGGYIRILSYKDKEYDTKKDKNNNLESKKLFQKIIIALGGPMANALSAFFIMVIVLFFYPQDSSLPIVKSILNNSFEHHYGLQKGDRIISINSINIEKYNDYIRVLNVDVYSEFKLTYIRNGDIKNIDINLKEYVESFLLPLLKNDLQYQKFLLNDVSFDLNDKDIVDKLITNLVKKNMLFERELIFEKLSIIQAITNSFDKILDIYRIMCITIYNMIFNNIGTENIGGPIRIMSASGTMMQQGLKSFLWLIVIISINLSFVNLLPLPMLDGGQIIMYILTCKINNRKIVDSIERNFTRLGIILLILITVFASYNDLKIFF